MDRFAIIEQRLEALEAEVKALKKKDAKKSEDKKLPPSKAETTPVEQ